MDKKLKASLIVLVISVGLVIVGTVSKYVFGDPPGQRTGVGSPGDVLFNAQFLYDSRAKYPSDPDSPFGIKGIMGPFAGTIANISELTGIETTATASLYYGYNWCKQYGGSDDCRDGDDTVMPLCVVVWAPLEENAGDQTYQACYSYHEPEGKWKWLAKRNSEEVNIQGKSQISNIELLVPGLTFADIAELE